jgi:hypothetical protein
MPENGIELATNIHTLTANFSNIDFTSTSFDTDISPLVSANARDNSSAHNQLVSASVAIAHLKTSLGITDNSCLSTHPKVGFTGS